MKKVRFESSVKVFNTEMEDTECHSPRPPTEKYKTKNKEYVSPRVLPFKHNTTDRFENSNSLPYPTINKTSLGPPLLPSNDLELSMLDVSMHEIRKNQSNHQIVGNRTGNCVKSHIINDQTVFDNLTSKPLTSIENIRPNDFANKKKYDNSSFFIRRDNLQNFNLADSAPINNQIQGLCLTKEEVQLAKKEGVMSRNITTDINIHQDIPPPDANNVCCCHNNHEILSKPMPGSQKQSPPRLQSYSCSNCHQYQYCSPHSHHSCKCTHCSPDSKVNLCGCKKSDYSNLIANPVDKKKWMLQKYDNNSRDICTEIGRKESLKKEKKEPTVGDLFRIIKLQNEQLQYLQEKVDKLILTNGDSGNQKIPNYVSDNVTIAGVSSDHQKISIGVMTSFEMVRTSTVINREIVTQTNENTQVHCNRSQISIKEVMSKSPVNLNVLEGIVPNKKSIGVQAEACSEQMVDGWQQHKQDNINNDRSLNELSLYNLHVDNSTTPLISPEQSLYLDVRDYSDSDSDSDDQSNVGWTYYNKVMTHVNGMLQDTDMPSSASALYRNTQKQCIQMQIDKTNVSVSKRVTFGDDPLVHQPHIYAAQTDTSLKMNQLASKYLKGVPLPSQPPFPKAAVVPIDMSFATRNYMERHKIIQGCTTTPQPPAAMELPKFLDITAIKRQPKL